jgi:hypothetical protein
MTHRKVVFDLQRGHDGYPPASQEGLWAKKVGDSLYKLDNIPFFAKGVSLGDVVVVRDEGDQECQFVKVHKPSGHATIRVVFFDRSLVTAVRDWVSQRGCSSELSHLSNLIAIDIPPSACYATIRDFLSDSAMHEKWDYEEGCVPPTLKKGPVKKGPE